MNVMDWQRRFRAGPAVWVVYEDGEVRELFENEEAARIALKFYGHRHTIGRLNIHTLELARERFDRSVPR